MSGMWLQPDNGDKWSPAQRAMIDQYVANVTNHIGELVAETCRHFEEDNCQDPEVCPGNAVSHYIHDMPEEHARALLIGAICDLAGFLTIVRAGQFTQERLQEHFVKQNALREELGGTDG